ncbi:phosphoglycerate mutase family protein [Schlegelella sp. S2-27]|uniref:Phosphoglycerate mutase family protein n=1 Tax=Caldimonas mangrovi TaxID=2944811 RepID=A0ABT0YUH6_9BURK|nr:histidine phosphatase family protein [Caldimonas mangrovi]MCM5682407.1 phosphoglycerate mutase family protein [Caldimonas mangrovi]
MSEDSRKHLIVITCGEAIGDPEGLIGGRRSHVLTATGRRQALLAGVELAHYCEQQEIRLADAVWLASPVARAVQSLWQVVAGLRETGLGPKRIDPRSEDGMSALDAGRLTGLRRADVLKLHPQVQADVDYAWPGGESLRAVRARSTSCLERHLLDNTGKAYVVVTHRAVWTALLTPSVYDNPDEQASALALEPKYARFAAFTFRNPNGLTTGLDLTHLPS